MRADPLASLTTAVTPQSQPIPGREADMTRNNAGGYTFRKTLWRDLEDFIILGTAGGTFYVGEKDHTIRSFDVVLEAIRADATRAVTLAADCWNGFPPRAPRPQGPIFVLAAVMAHGDAAGGQEARRLGARMCRTTDHRVMFYGYYKQLAGKMGAGDHLKFAPSHTVRKMMASWFTAPAEDVAFTCLKGKSRTSPQGEAVSVMDMLRACHPASPTPAHAALFEYLTGGDIAPAAEMLSGVRRFALAQGCDSEAAAAEMIRELKVPWEFVPSQFRKKAAWQELAGTTGMTALLRNLALMTRLGALEPLSDTAATVVRRLTDPEAIRKSRIHPVDVWLAGAAYAAGQAWRPGKDRELWTPVTQVLTALDTTFLTSFGNVTPTGKKLLVAVDCSGSMTAAMALTSGAPIGRAYDVAGMMAAILAKIEPNVQVIEVDTSVHSSQITANSTLAELRHRHPPGGGTDMAQPFEYARRSRTFYDGFVILTDSETWTGRWHPSQALEAYRSSVNSAARVVVVSMTAAGHSIGDPTDAGVLNIAGLDGTLPALVSGFIR